MSIRVLVVDDSSFVREVLREVLEPYADITVVGEARDGRDASLQLEMLKPDVITMDLLMPMMGGIETVEAIMKRAPIPILVLADIQGRPQLRDEALAAGASGVFAKPPAGFDDRTSNALARAIRDASATRVQRQQDESHDASRLKLSRLRVLGIVSSTGGPKVLAHFLSALPATLSVPICLVQHTTPGFTESLVSWLSKSCSLTVKTAREGQVLRPGEVTIAPDEKHLEILRGGVVHLSSDPPVSSLRPSGDVLLTSLASSMGAGAGGLVCTGMGTDGAKGLAAIERAGGLCLVQDPSTTIVDAMAKSAIRLAPSSAPIRLGDLAKTLARTKS